MNETTMQQTQTGESLPPKGLELLPTIPKDLVAQHIPEQERDVVGSALWKPVYQGQPVNHVNNVNTDIDIAHISRGMIHPWPKGAGFSLPLDPTNYKKIGLYNWVVYGHGGPGLVVLISIGAAYIGLLSWIMVLFITLAATILACNIGARSKWNRKREQEQD